MVFIHHSNSSKVVTLTELKSAGLISAPEEEPQYPSPPYAPFSSKYPKRGAWPSYERALEDAPYASHHEGKDRSHADFEFCLIAIDRGFSVEETAEELFRRSEKAQEEGRRYAIFTAERAASIVARRKSNR